MSVIHEKISITTTEKGLVKPPCSSAATMAIAHGCWIDLEVMQETKTSLLGSPTYPFIQIKSFRNI